MRADLICTVLLLRPECYTRFCSTHYTFSFNPLPEDNFLDSSKLREFADDNFKFDEYGRKLSKREENTVGKGKIARTSNFSFSHSVFKRLASQGCQKVSLSGKHEVA